MLAKTNVIKNKKVDKLIKETTKLTKVIFINFVITISYLRKQVDKKTKKVN
jgi:preprotein translocase subunit SecG